MKLVSLIRVVVMEFDCKCENVGVKACTSRELWYCHVHNERVFTFLDDFIFLHLEHFKRVSFSLPHFLYICVMILVSFATLFTVGGGQYVVVKLHSI